MNAQLHTAETKEMHLRSNCAKIKPPPYTMPETAFTHRHDAKNLYRVSSGSPIRLTHQECAPRHNMRRN